MTARTITYPIRVEGGITRVVAGGGAEDRTMVLVHGVGSHAGWWRNNIADLAALGFRVMAVDLPGHGFAARQPGWPLTVLGYRDFLLSFLRSFVGRPAILVGHSLGGQVAAAAAIEDPQCVTHLILSAPTGITALGAERLRATEKRQTDFSRAGIEAKLRFATADPKLVTDEWVEEDFRINNGPGAHVSLRAIARHLAAELDDYVIGKDLAEAAAALPVLIVWGGADRSIPLASGQVAKDAVPNAHFVVIPDVAHVPQYEAPQQFAEAMKAFLGGSSQ
jgi:2-hydroxy-6-oxonona-2,4-dienedioate hydrolase